MGFPYPGCLGGTTGLTVDPAGGCSVVDGWLDQFVLCVPGLMLVYGMLLKKSVGRNAGGSRSGISTSMRPGIGPAYG